MGYLARREQMRRKVIILGAGGMLGSEMLQVLSSDDSLDIIPVDRGTLNGMGILQFVSTIEEGSLVVNCVGKTKPMIDESSPDSVEKAVEANVLLPLALVKAKTKTIQIATDCVFSGKNGSYNELSEHNATDVYGKTKSLGEIAGIMHIRSSIIGREPPGRRRFLLEWFLELEKNATVNGFTNHFWNGVTTTAFSQVVLGIIKKDKFQAGVFHLVPSDLVSKRELLEMIAETHNRTDVVIKPTTSVYTNRSLCTGDPKFNQMMWELAGYMNPPTIRSLIKEIVW
jgi:dTDP-4-dehydrorhamnose reductase